MHGGRALQCSCGCIRGEPALGCARLEPPLIASLPPLPAGLAVNPFTVAATYGTDWVATNLPATIDFAEFNVYPETWVRGCSTAVPSPLPCQLPCRRLGSGLASPCGCPCRHALHPPTPQSIAPANYEAWINAWVEQHSADAKSPLRRPAIIKEFGANVSWC